MRRVTSQGQRNNDEQTRASSGGTLSRRGRRYAAAMQAVARVLQEGEPNVLEEMRYFRRYEGRGGDE